MLPRRFRWWAGLLGVHRPALADAGGVERTLAPAWKMGTGGVLARALSPAVLRAGGLLCGETLRLDLHPANLQHPRHMLALEWVLSRAERRREAITYDELLAARG